MPFVPVKSKARSKTIVVFSAQLIGALVALILHYTQAVTLGPGALSAAYTCVLTALVGVVLRFYTSTPVRRSKDMAPCDGCPHVRSNKCPVVCPPGFGSIVSNGPDLVGVDFGPGESVTNYERDDGGKMTKVTRSTVLVVLLLLLLGGCGASLEHAAEKAGTCLGRCALACGYQMVQDLTCPVVPPPAKVTPVEPE